MNSIQDMERAYERGIEPSRFISHRIGSLKINKLNKLHEFITAIENYVISIIFIDDH